MGVEPGEPGAEADLRGGGDANDFDSGVDGAGIGFGSLGTEGDVGEQVDFAHDDKV